MSTASNNFGFSNSVQVINWNNLPATTCVASLWGGGGGAGGADAGNRGGRGSGGGYAQVTFEVSGFDEIYIAVGGGGGAGVSSRNSAAGGAAGPAFSGAEVFNTLNLVSGSIVRRTNPAYVGFLNSIGVWYNYGATVFDETRTCNFPLTGVYTFSISCDNSGEIYLDGAQIVATPSPVGFSAVYTARITVSAGNHTIRVRGTNLGGPASLGATVVGDFSYSGGSGGRAGGTGSSGGGGGGGGATVLLRNLQVMAIAGGGGGGGGAGVAGISPNRDAPGGRSPQPGFTAGMNGQNCITADGGGGGGGGGGYSAVGAGAGGAASASYDFGAGAGYFGGIYAPTWDAPGRAQYSYNTVPANIDKRPGSAGNAGASSSQPGQGGACVLEFLFNSTRVKTTFSIFGNTFTGWRTTRDAWIKSNGVWQSVQNAWIKHNGQWIVTIPSDNTVPSSSKVPGLFGSNPRPFS